MTTTTMSVLIEYRFVAALASGRTEMQMGIPCAAVVPADGSRPARERDYLSHLHLGPHSQLRQRREVLVLRVEPVIEAGVLGRMAQP